MITKTALFGAVAAIAIAPAAAQDYKGFYGSLMAGYNEVQDQDASYLPDGEFKYEGGTALGGALGYAYGNGFRTELELMGRENDVDEILNFGKTSGSFGGLGYSNDSELTSLMVNALYDFDGGVESLKPFVGVGLGYGMIDTTANAVASGLGRTAVSEHDAGAMWQAIAGFAIPLADNLAFDVSYRYLAAFEDFSYANSTVTTSPGVLAGASVDVDYAAHTVLAGLRWNFGPAAPVRPRATPAPAPAPRAASPALLDEQDFVEDIELTIYFDLNSATLTNAARTLIANAAAEAKEGDISSVTIAGNTDTSGSSAYNRVLSQRRANAVRQALIAEGVPGSLISVNAFGESNLATTTPDGTREPLNRRADVTIKFE